MSGDRDFLRLWIARSTSDLGSSVGMVALPMVAIIALNASAFQVTLLTALSAVVAAAFAFPLGITVDRRRKRPVMIAADLARAVALGSVPLAALLGWLTYPQLCAVAVINAVFALAFGAASQAHLKNLVPRTALADANGRLESTLWGANTVGPPIGGALAGLVGAAATLLIDAVSFVTSAILVRTIKKPEPDPPVIKVEPLWPRLTAGWSFLFRDRLLRRCLISYTLFASASAALSPLEPLFILRELGGEPWQFGVAFGAPCLAGFIGARLARRTIERLGLLRSVWITSLLRGPALLIFPFAPADNLGIVLCGVALGICLFFASISNASLTTYRQLHTPDELMGRAATAWSMLLRITQPILILVGGALASGIGIRWALGIVVTVLCLSALILPTSENLEPTKATSD